MGGYKIPRLAVERTDKELKEQVENSDKIDRVASKAMTDLRNRVLNAQPATKTNSKRSFQSIMAPKAFELSAKRIRSGYSREQAFASTPKPAPAQPRAELCSISSVESAGNESIGLTSIPSDCSELAALNAAVDRCETTGQLSNSSDFDVLVVATQDAELRNYREATQVIDSTSSDSVVSFDSNEGAPQRSVVSVVPSEQRNLSCASTSLASVEGAPQPSVVSVVPSKRKNLSSGSDVSGLCLDANSLIIGKSFTAEKSFNVKRQKLIRKIKELAQARLLLMFIQLEAR